MSPSLHVCRICGKKFATPKGVYGHQRIHSGSQRIWGFKESRVFSTSASAKSTSIESESLDPLRRGYKATSSLSLKESSSFMTETEEHEMIEAAMSLVMLSERVVVIRNLPPGDVAMDLELKPMQETIIGCVESKQEASEVMGFEKSATCSDVAMDLELKPMQEKIIGCVESKQEYSEVMDFEKSTTCSDVVAQALPSPVRSNLQTKPQSNFNYRFKICGKSFVCSQALGDHQKLHRSMRYKLAHKRRTLEGGYSLSGSSSFEEPQGTLSAGFVFSVSKSSGQSFLNVT